jgi:hypothetical protein
MVPTGSELGLVATPSLAGLAFAFISAGPITLSIIAAVNIRVCHAILGQIDHDSDHQYRLFTRLSCFHAWTNS